MLRLLASLIWLTALLAPLARAEGPLLVELFASKNCRNCPAAHRIMQAVDKTSDDILILTWSVDYWDYLGGKDPMAIAESSVRQRGYADQFKIRGPYTPQAIFGGRVQTAGNREQRVKAAIAEAQAARTSGISLSRSDRRVTLMGDPGGLTDIWWVTYLAGPANTTKMVNPVTSARQLGPWLGGKANLTLPACESGCALIVQEAGPGAVLAVMDGS